MRRLLFALLISPAAFAQPPTGPPPTMTQYIGTVRDLTQAVVTSGRITFTLASPGGVIPGTGSFVATTVSCQINAAGTPVSSSDGLGPCLITNNTSLTPTGTSYRICIQPYSVSPGSCFYDYATGGAKDISTIVPTLQTGPWSYGSLAGPQGPIGPPGGSLSYPGVVSDTANGLNITGNAAASSVTVNTASATNSSFLSQLLTMNALGVPYSMAGQVIGGAGNASPDATAIDFFPVGLNPLTYGLAFEDSFVGNTGCVLCIGIADGADGESQHIRFTSHRGVRNMPSTGDLYMTGTGSSLTGQGYAYSNVLNWHGGINFTSYSAPNVIQSTYANSAAHDLLDILAPNDTNGAIIEQFLGVDHVNNRNALLTAFHYVGTGSTSNWAGFGFLGARDILKVYPLGHVDVAGDLNVSGAVTANGLTTGCAQLPCPVVAPTATTAQTADWGPVTLKTPAADGWYTIRCTLTTSVAATTSSTRPPCQAIYTDAEDGLAKAGILVPGVTTNSAAESQGGSQLIHVKTGTPIKVQTFGYVSVGATALSYKANYSLDWNGN